MPKQNPFVKAVQALRALEGEQFSLAVTLARPNHKNRKKPGPKPGFKRTPKKLPASRPGQKRIEAAEEA